MDKVFVPNINAAETIELVRELRAKGLIQGKDFEFSYQRTEYDDDSYNITVPSGCHFTFTDNKWATFFRMKYG